MNTLSQEQINQLPVDAETGLIIQSYGNESVDNKWLSFLNNSGNVGRIDDNGNMFTYYAVKHDGKNNIYLGKLYYTKINGNTYKQYNVVNTKGEIMPVNFKYSDYDPINDITKDQYI